MTTQALLTLIVFSVLKGAAFGILFAWMFPPLHRYLIARMGHDAGSLRRIAFGSRPYWGLAMVSGAGFAQLDLVQRVSEAAGLPGLLLWAVIGLFGLTACGAVLVGPHDQQGQAGGDAAGQAFKQRG